MKRKENKNADIANQEKMVQYDFIGREKGRISGAKALLDHQVCESI